MKPEEKKEYIFPQMRVVVLKYQNKLMECSPASDGDGTCNSLEGAEDYPNGPVG